ncbi:hypothetical protein [Sporosarcina sp. USHLN248]|uniref:hypothetical protein n=1 Tax=Sporosarcina sp. USHLN248 TaxID=3081300 RepID=UPI003016E3E7
MKVFKMNDFDWVCAVSEEQAKEFYEQFIDRNEIEEDFEGEVSLTETMWIPIDDLPVEELKKQQEMKMFYGEMHTKKTFHWVIENENIKEPCIISSTEW